jgi:hypothetical protein
LSQFFRARFQKIKLSLLLMLPMYTLPELIYSPKVGFIPQIFLVLAIIRAAKIALFDLCIKTDMTRYSGLGCLVQGLKPNVTYFKTRTPAICLIYTSCGLRGTGFWRKIEHCRVAS